MLIMGRRNRKRARRETVADFDGKTKYAALKDYLKQDIITGKRRAGEKLPSENELANAWKVSRHTVRKALAILENEGYVKPEHGRGTFVAVRTGTGKASKNIAVITTYLSDYIFPRVIQGIDHVLTDKGYSIILKNTGNSRYREAKCLEELLKKDIDGFIIEPSKSQIYCSHTEYYNRMDFLKIPYVFIQGCYLQMKDKPHILMDDCVGGYLITKHLIELGHKHIIGIFKADDSQGKQRHKGYVKALQEAGFSYDPDMVIWFHTEDRAVTPARVLRQMIQEGVSAQGIVCYNDQIAIEVIKELDYMGVKVPEDISVTGYDNSYIAENAKIPITTVAHPHERLGEAAARLLIEKLDGVSDEDSQVERMLKPRLVVRESCVRRG